MSIFKNRDQEILTAIKEQSEIIDKTFVALIEINRMLLDIKNTVGPEYGPNATVSMKSISTKKHKHTRYTKEQKNKISSMLEAGKTPIYISKKINIPLSTVYHMQTATSYKTKQKVTNGNRKAN